MIFYLILLLVWREYYSGSFVIAALMKVEGENNSLWCEQLIHSINCYTSRIENTLGTKTHACDFFFLIYLLNSNMAPNEAKTKLTTNNNVVANNHAIRVTLVYCSTLNATIDEFIYDTRCRARDILWMIRLHHSQHTDISSDVKIQFSYQFFFCHFILYHHTWMRCMAVSTKSVAGVYSDITLIRIIWIFSKSHSFAPFLSQSETFEFSFSFEKSE